MVVDHGDEASRLCSDRLSPLPETETSGSCLGSSGDDQLEDDEMALDDNEMALEQPKSEPALSSKVDIKRGHSQNRSHLTLRHCLCKFFWGHEPPSENPSYTPEHSCISIAHCAELRVLAKNGMPTFHVHN